MTKPLLQYPNEQAPYLEGFLYKFFHNFLAKHKFSLQIKGIKNADPPRENDQCIMDGACSDPTILDCDIQQIYYYKSYLQMKWTSNICTAD